MLIIKTRKDMQAQCRLWRQEGQTIGFVPTMGALHAGHLSLVEASRKQAQKTVASLFVNPLQFGPKEDLAKYPKKEEQDLQMLKQLGVAAVFVATPEDMYPADFETYVDVTRTSLGLCGQSRPSHFRGVATVVTKLLNIVQPHWAYFGEKDMQQLRVIQALVRDLDMDLEVVSCPTVRESDGLAMSSRNAYLDAVQRKRAASLYQALQMARQYIEKGERSVAVVKASMTSFLKEIPEVNIDYLDIVDYNKLKSVSSIQGQVVIILAVFLGQTRLIDNLVVKV